MRLCKLQANQITCYKDCIASKNIPDDYTQLMIGQNRLTSACGQNEVHMASQRECISGKNDLLHRIRSSQRQKPTNSRIIYITLVYLPFQLTYVTVGTAVLLRALTHIRDGACLVHTGASVLTWRRQNTLIAFYNQKTKSMQFNETNVFGLIYVIYGCNYLSSKHNGSQWEYTSPIA